VASRRVWWRIAIAAASLLAVLAVAGVWAAARVDPVREELLGVAGLLTTLQQQLDAGDLPLTRTTLSALQDRTEAARSRTAGIDWRAASHAPGLGADIQAVRTAAEVLDDLSHQALPIMVDLAGSLDLTALVPQSGHLDLDPLRAAAPRLAEAQASVETAAERIDAIDSKGLMPPLRDAVTRLQGGLEKLRALTRDAVRASVLLPSMLGGSGPRTYLVLMQNLAEVRATGGMPGAFLVIRADQGTLSLVDQGSAAAALQVFPEPVLPLSDAQLALYSERLGIYPADVNFTPHFPTAALLAREMYRRRSGTTVDGVLATDPVALAYLLRVTGPMTVPNGPSLTADNAVRVLLSEAYATMTGPEQDQYFAAAARTVFEALTQHTTEPRGALAALAHATNERRLLVWSAHPEEQRAIEGTMLEGSLPEREEGGQTTVGVFLNDGSGAKLGYYLTHSAVLEPRLRARRAARPATATRSRLRRSVQRVARRRTRARTGRRPLHGADQRHGLQPGRRRDHGDDAGRCSGPVRPGNRAATLCRGQDCRPTTRTDPYGHGHVAHRAPSRTGLLHGPVGHPWSKQLEHRLQNR
jgi:hypothetical protein